MEHAFGKFLVIAVIGGCGWLILVILEKISSNSTPATINKTSLNFMRHIIIKLKDSAEQDISDTGTYKIVTPLIAGSIGLILSLGYYVGYTTICKDTVIGILVLLVVSFGSIASVRLVTKRKLGAFQLLSLIITVIALLLYVMFFALRGMRSI